MFSKGKVVIIFSVLVLPVAVEAQLIGGSDAGQLGTMFENLMLFIDRVLIPFIISLGFLFFIWGLFLYFVLGGSDEEKKLKGRSLLVNATFAFLIIIIFFGLINLLATSTGLEGETLENIPRVYNP